jgi:[acyl-carrier-protein] S-malonyltransferase
MSAVIGLDAAAVEVMCADTPGYVIAANYNAPGQTVISGDADSVAAAEEALKAAGASRVVRLNVSGAFHSRHMQAAASELSGFLATLSFGVPSAAIYSNLTGKRLDIPTESAARNAFFVDYIPKQMANPVRFCECGENMLADGYARFYEIGVGRVLSGLMKRIDTGKKAELLTV